MTTTKNEKPGQFIHCEIPPRDLQELEELVSNYLEYYNPPEEEERKLRPISERLWRLLHGYGYTSALPFAIEVSRRDQITNEMSFIGDFDKGFYNILKRASNEELSNLYHDGGYATESVWGKVAQLMLERICLERKYDPWTRKSLEAQKQ